MAAEITRAEFETRVGVLESEVEGEKMVTRHILEQTRRNSDDLAAVKTRLDRVERKVDDLSTHMNRLERKVDSNGAAIDDLKRELPKQIAEEMREVLRERDAKR